MFLGSLNKSNEINPLFYINQVFLTNASPNPMNKLNINPENDAVNPINPNPILASFMLTIRSHVEFPKAKSVMPRYV